MIKKLFFSSIVLMFFTIGLNAQQVKTIKTNATTSTNKKVNKPKSNIVFTPKQKQPKVFVHENSPLMKKSKKIETKQKAVQKKEQ